MMSDYALDAVEKRTGRSLYIISLYLPTPAKATDWPGYRPTPRFYWVVFCKLYANQPGVMSQALVLIGPMTSTYPNSGSGVHSMSAKFLSVPTMTVFPITIRNFTGKAFALQVDSNATIADVKNLVDTFKKPGSVAGVGTSRNRAIQLGYQGHRLRDHQRISHYGITKEATLHILPPSRVQKITLQFERNEDNRKLFTLSVDPDITVVQLKREIEIEEELEVTQLKYVENEENEDEDLVISELKELENDTKISDYPLENETILVYTYTISVIAGSLSLTFSVEPSKPVSVLRELLGHNLSSVADLCFVWNGEELDENLTFSNYKIPSESRIEFNIPREFVVDLAVDEYGTPRKLKIPVNKDQTLADFRETATIVHGIPLSEDILILVGQELAGEDKSINELGFIPGCVIHAVGYISLQVEAPFKVFDTLTLHPLTRLSAIREILKSESPEKPLDGYWFTLDGKARLKDSRTLWDLEIISGSRIYMRGHALTFTIARGFFKDGDEVPISSTSFDIEVDEEETVWGLKERIALQTHIPMDKQRLLIRGKVREDEWTLKRHGLVGGETILLIWSDLTPGFQPLAEADLGMTDEVLRAESSANHPSNPPANESPSLLPAPISELLHEDGV